MEIYNQTPENKTTYNRSPNITIKKKMNILIVDDDLNGAECLKEILEYRGHNVQIIDDATRCITLCQNNKYDIVFIDYHMEGLDGTELTMILQDQKIGKTIIFAYTGDSSKDAIGLFKATGMAGAIIKPFDMSCFEMLLNYLEDHYFFSQQTAIQIAKKSNRTILIF
jgi:CheY-like chemotaxis protein